MTWQDFPEILKALQFDDEPAGGSLVICKDGQEVVNTSIGKARLDDDGDWHDKRLSVNFSIGKGVMATLVAVLVSQGMLDYDTPICHYWSEFGVNDKQNITPRHILTHTSGLFDVASISQELHELTDWQVMTTKVAQMSPTIPKGQDKQSYASAYSALVSGWILGGLVERVTKMPLQTALDIIKTGQDYQKADILMLSDGDCQLSETFSQKFHTQKHQARCMVYSVLCDGSRWADNFSDEMIVL